MRLRRLHRINFISLTPCLMSRKLIVGVVVAVVIAAIGVFFFLRFSPSGAVKSVVEQQFIAISVGDLEKAHTFLSKEKQEAINTYDYRYYIAQHPLLEYNLKRMYKSIAIQDSTATAYVDVEDVDGNKGGIDVYLVKEGDQWKVSAYNFVSADVTGQK